MGMHPYNTAMLGNGDVLGFHNVILTGVSKSRPLFEASYPKVTMRDVISET